MPGPGTGPRPGGSETLNYTTDLCYRVVDEVPDNRTEVNCGVPRNPFPLPPPPPRKISDISKLDAIALPHVFPFTIHNHVTGII